MKISNNLMITLLILVCVSPVTNAFSNESFRWSLKENENKNDSVNRFFGTVTSLMGEHVRVILARNTINHEAYLQLHIYNSGCTNSIEGTQAKMVVNNKEVIFNLQCPNNKELVLLPASKENKKFLINEFSGSENVRVYYKGKAYTTITPLGFNKVFKAIKNQ